MATDYPNGIDNFTNPTATDNLDSVTVPHATQHANANDAIEAIESELGTNPKGTKASVKARLDAVDTELADINDTSISTSLPLTSSGTVGNDNLVVGINATPNDTANYVVQRDANQSFSIGAINFDTASAQTSAVGKLYWDGNGSLALGLLGGNVTVGINEDLVCYVTNAESTTLNVGEVVYLYGAQGNRPTVKRASNTSDATSAKTFGFVAESIAAGQAGFVTIRGTARKINTSAFNPGDPLYLGSTPGTFTTTKPVAPNHLVYLGVVERANAGNGQIQVVVQNGYELDEIHDVLITSKTNGDYLVYESATNLWKNKQISATAPVTYDAATRTIAANSASTSASGVVQLTDSTSSTSTTTAATPNAVKSAYDLANAAIPATQKGAANGVATLDANSKVPQAQLPAVAITNTYVVNSQAAMLALTAEEGDVAIRTDVSKSYILTATPASTLGNWQELLSPPDAVTSVDGRTGVVTLSDLYAARSRTISTTAPLSGGGDLSANRTLSIDDASTTAKGAVQLEDSTSSTSTTKAATPNSVKSAYDLASGKPSLSSNNPVALGTAAPGTSGLASRDDHVHPTTGLALLDAANTFTAGQTITPATAVVPLTLNAFATGSQNVFTVNGQSGGLSYFGQFANLRLAPGAAHSVGNNISGVSWGVTAANASTIGTVIRGAASQTGDLFQAQNSAASVLAKIDASGNLFAPSLRSATASTATLTTNGDTGGLLISTVAAANKGVTVKGVASQSADLIQVQNSSGTVLDAFDANGNQRSQTQLIQYGAEGSVLQNVPNRVATAEQLLKQSVWWIDAAHSASNGQTIKNLGWGGSALDCTLGSSTAVDTNDPQYLAWDGVNYVYLSGVASNYLSVPDATNLRITGNLDLRALVALDDWTPSVVTGILGKVQSSGNFSYLMRVNTNGTLNFVWTEDGTTTRAVSSTVAPTVTDGTQLWIRLTLTVNNGASGNDAKFYTSNDGIVWTQLGSTVTSGGVTSIYSGTSPVEIGTYYGGSTGPMAGKIYRAQICNGIDGVPVLDVDTSVIASGSATSFTALTGQTVTVNRSTSGRKTVCVTNPLWLFGTDDYMEVNNRWLEHTGSNYLYLPGVALNYASTPDSTALSITGDIDLRVKVALDDWTPSTQTDFISKWGAGTRSYDLALTTGGNPVLYWSTDGLSASVKTVTSPVTAGITDGSVKWIRATLDVDNGASGNDVKFFTSDDGSTWTQLGATITTAGVTSIFDSTADLRIGHNAAFDWPLRGKVFRAQVYNGIGGTLAFDANFETGITSNLPTTFTESSANAATVTINYSGTGYRSAGVIASTYVFPGNPNTFKLSTTSLLDFGATDDATVLIVNRQWGTPTNFGRLISKEYTSNGNQGYNIQNYGTGYSYTAAIYSGSQTATGSGTPTYTPGSTKLVGFVLDRTAQTLIRYQDTIGTSVSATGVGSIASISTLTIGKKSDGASAPDMEVSSIAIFRRALTASEIAILNNYFQGRVA